MLTVTILVMVVAMAAAVAGVALFQRYRRRDRLVVKFCHLLELDPLREHTVDSHTELRKSLVQALKREQTDFDFGRFQRQSSVDPDLARTVAEDVFRSYVTLSSIDGIINQREAATLNALAEVLHVSDATRMGIEKQAGVLQRAEDCGDERRRR